MKIWKSVAAVMINGDKDLARILKTFQVLLENILIMEKSSLILPQLLKIIINLKLILIDSFNMKEDILLVEKYSPISK